jgi:hypothetical protein
MMDANELLHRPRPWLLIDRTRAAIIVEIGSYVREHYGVHGQGFGIVGRRTSILSVDLSSAFNPMRSTRVYSAYIRQHRIARRSVGVLPLAAFSQDAAPVMPATVGVLVVDGGHYGRQQRS